MDCDIQYGAAQKRLPEPNLPTKHPPFPRLQDLKGSHTSVPNIQVAIEYSVSCRREGRDLI